MLDPTDQFANFRSAHYKTGGAGVSEGTEQLTITEVKLYTPNYSALDYYGTTLVAAGGLSCFDGKESFPATLDTPLSATVAVTSVDPTAHPDNLASFINQFWLLPGESVDFKGVLVHIDRNGVKYRSGEFDLGTVSNDSGDTHRYSLAFELELSETLAPFSLNGHRLSLEVYTNERYTTTPGEEFNLMFRGGVYWNETFSTFMADATSMVGPSNGAGNTDAWHFNPVPIYTSSGELTSVIPPASNVMAQAGNYIFLVSSEDPYDIRFTKPLDDRIGPEFNPLLSLEAPPESGGVVSLAGEADRLLLLCRTGVWELFVAGSGPDAAGQGTFPPFRRIWGGEGCITHRGTVSGPFGTFFVADSGPKIVGRDGSVVDVALDLGLTDFSDLVRTVYVSADQELWMFMGDGAYVFDLARGQWTSASSTALAVAVKDRQMFRLTNDAELFQHTSSPGGEQILAKYVSPWLSFDGPMGLKRVRRIGALVRVISGSIGKLRVSVAYDYIDTEVDSAEWASSELGSLVKPVQLLVRPSRQKADSYRITVEEVGEAPPQGDPVSDLRWSLVDISLEVAAKGGLIKLQTEAKK